ncbi:ABC transporter substrate-binding protein [Lederbergia galactosidilytica]|uniref:Metal ABC transporter substrate-binding protein n=1 Tax=Lederbergia galactosidilytica TaxID=217031 RepID=A0A177ZP33_9BACI|nr:ABC transporter substrate-binding protein [Lederbergia galactosidilytica]KRG14832.1 metal ABC transporter substrate-binding protein [Virgibacillus soli]MBP1914504.1 NitT/TauT family transport system substrate-binding protein [Lederbergia galactosidilytica]OAK69080.1 metal ABC transporter substrate-binding protein [Lederbergia galactosidilytica]
MKRIVVGLMLLMFLPTIVACGKQATPVDGKPVIKIGYLPITHAGPLFIDTHLHDGEVGAYQIEMIKFGSWPDLMDALNTGRIDGASVLIELAMKAKEKGIDLKAVALGHKDGNVLISTDDIHNAHDLNGETFAIPHKYSTHNLLLNEYMENAGMKYEDVNVVEMPPAEMPAALSEKRIAGYVVAEPFGAMSVVLGKGKVLAHSDEVWPHSYCCVLVLRNDFIRANKSEVQTFIEQYANAGNIADSRSSEVYEAYLYYMKVDKEVLDLSLQWISYDDLRIEQDEYEKLRKRVIEMGLSKNPPTYDEFVDLSFLGNVEGTK